MTISKNSDMRIIEQAFQSSPGYVLDFSDRTYRDFFEDEFGIDIDSGKYQANGASKMNRLRTFCRVEKSATVVKVLRSLWSYKEGIYGIDPSSELIKRNLFDLIAKIEIGDNIPATDAFRNFENNETLDEIITSINRDMGANRPIAALDRLHTYCSKMFGYLLDRKQIEWNRSEPLQSRVGKYVKLINSEGKLHDMSMQILKNSIGVFDKFNHVRNNNSLAHDNEIIDKHEARFIFDSVVAILRFIKAVDPDSF